MIEYYKKHLHGLQQFIYFFYNISGTSFTTAKLKNRFEFYVQKNFPKDYLVVANQQILNMDFFAAQKLLNFDENWIYFENLCNGQTTIRFEFFFKK